MTNSSHPSDSPDVVGPILSAAQSYIAASDAAVACLCEGRCEHYQAMMAARTAFHDHLLDVPSLRLARSLTQLQEERERLRGAIEWVLGWQENEFPPGEELDGARWRRKELRRRAFASPSSLPREGANG